MQGPQRKPGNYLVYDGGQSALPGLYITEEMCARLQYDLESDEEIRICDHCDLLGGSGTGAVAAILLGRMGLTTSQAINAYLKLEPALSVQPTKDEDERRRNTEMFRAAFTGVLEKAGFTADTPMMDKAAPKTLVNLVNAVVGYANPTKELLQEAQRVFDGDAEVSSIVSLGAGKQEVLRVAGVGDEGGLMDAMAKMALDSEQTHKELDGRLHQSSVYFRLNIERELTGYISVSSIHAHTLAYLQEGGTDRLLNDVVRSIKVRQKGCTLKDISSVAVVEFAMKPRPSLVRNFVGREDILEKMRQTHVVARSPDPGLPAITVLLGLGGSGKTQIALRFALDHEERSRDAPVYFFNASSEAKLKADYELAIRTRDSSSRSKSHEDALVWFANQKDPWLIIMDNADDPSVDLFHFVPKSSHGNVIITTRNSTYKILAPNSSHHVEGLASSEAIELILKGSAYIDDEDNRGYAQKIAEALGHLPLALAHAVGYISVHRCLPTYLDMFLGSRLKFLASKPTLSQDYNSTLAATVEMSLESIPPAARDVMVLLSGFDATSVAQSIIVKASERQFRHIDGRSEDEALRPETIEQANALMAIFCPSGKWSESDLNDIIQQCLQYSLLQVTVHGNARFYSMHILVQAYLQSTSTHIREHHIGPLVVRLLGSATTIDNYYKYRAFNRLLSPHLILATMDDMVEAGDHFRFGQVLLEQGNARLSDEHLSRCLALRRSGLGEKHPDTMLVMRDLTLSYYDLGRYQEGLDLGMKLLDLRKEISGDEHPETLIAMNNLAMFHYGMGRFQEALKLWVKVLDLRKSILQDEHPDTLQAMGNLAVSYSALGRYQEALELEIKVLDLRKRILGDENPDTLRAIGNLASSYRDLGRHQDALELWMKVLDLWKRTSGDEHPDTLLTMWNLSFTLADLGMKEQEIILLQSTLPLYEKVHGSDYLETKRIKRNLGSLLESS